MTEFLNPRLPVGTVLDDHSRVIYPVEPIDYPIYTPIYPRPVKPIELVYQPEWRLEALPYVDIAAITNIVKPLRVGDFWLWPDAKPVRTESERSTTLLRREIPTVMIRNHSSTARPYIFEGGMIDPGILQLIKLPTNRAFYAPAAPHLIDCVLTIQSVTENNSVRIQGGTVVLSIGSYAAESPVALHSQWSDALHAAEYPLSLWNFIPQQLNNLRAALELPDTMLTSEPSATVNVDTGMVTFIIELSEYGALAWKQAFEQERGGSLAGICRLEAVYFSGSGSQSVTAPQKLETSLGVLVAGCNASNIIRINPQETFDVHLIVQGHSLLQSIVMSMTPNVGQAPANQVYGAAGGTTTLSITTQDVQSVRIPWQVELTFAMQQGWPTFAVSGEFSATTQWVEIINPASWLLPYLFLTLDVNDRGQPIARASTGEADTTNGILTYNAGDRLLRSEFNASHQTPVRVVLPANLPNQTFGELTFSMMATRGDNTKLESRRLQQTDNYVIVKIFPDAQIHIITSGDTLPESSPDLALLALLQSLG